MSITTSTRGSSGFARFSLSDALMSKLQLTCEEALSASTETVALQLLDDLGHPIGLGRMTSALDPCGRRLVRKHLRHSVHEAV